MRIASNVNRNNEESSPKLETRRTGAVFLSLIVATNFVAWMQLVERGIDSAMSPSPAEGALAIASCFLAAGMVLGVWLLARRVPAEGAQIARARDTGLLLALLAAAANLALAAVIHMRAPSASFGGILKWFAVIWYGLILPTQLAAAFFKGRASIPSPRLPDPHLSPRPD